MKIARSIGIFSLTLLLLGWHHAWGQAEQTAKLIEAAKKEGEVVIYGTMSLEAVNLLNARFREKYPFIDVKLNRLGSGKFAPRVIAEVRANKHLADILQTNSLTLHYIKKEGFLTNYLSPEDRFYPKQFKDQGYWTTTNMNVHVLAHNTKLIARDKAPKTYDDLLSPAWKGKMLSDTSEQWGALMFQIMGKEKAIRHMRELAKQNLSLRRIERHASAADRRRRIVDRFRFDPRSCGRSQKTRRADRLDRAQSRPGRHQRARDRAAATASQRGAAVLGLPAFTGRPKSRPGHQTTSGALRSFE